MGISFYYAVRILWRECGRDSNFDNPSKPPLDRGGLVAREFLTNIHKIKIPKIQKDLGDFAVWTRLEPALRACGLAIFILTTPPNLHKTMVKI